MLMRQSTYFLEIGYTLNSLYNGHLNLLCLFVNLVLCVGHVKYYLNGQWITVWITVESNRNIYVHWW